MIVNRRYIGLFMLVIPAIPLAAMVPDTASAVRTIQIVDKEKVEMEVHAFSDYVAGAYTVYLKEKKSDDNTLLPIVIGGCEAVAIGRHAAGLAFPRPLTYDLFCNFLDTAGIELMEIIITELKQNTFYAVIVFVQGSKRWEIDARPSDAMNLAMRMKCKIFTYRKVIKEAGIEMGE